MHHVPSAWDAGSGGAPQGCWAGPGRSCSLDLELAIGRRSSKGAEIGFRSSALLNAGSLAFAAEVNWGHQRIPKRSATNTTAAPMAISSMDPNGDIRSCRIRRIPQPLRCRRWVASCDGF